MPKFSRFLQALLFKQSFHYCAIVFLGLVSFYLFVYDLSRMELLDLNVYRAAGARLAAGQNIYDFIYRVPNPDGKIIPLYYLYPPFLAWAFKLLAAWPSAETLRLAWCFLSYLAVWGTALSLAALVPATFLGGHSFPLRLTGLLFFVICFEPIYLGIGDGQVDALVLFLLALFLVLAQRGKDVGAGAALAGAALIKISPGLIFIGPLVLRRYRILWSGLSVGALSFAVLWLAAGGGVIKDFFAFIPKIGAGILVEDYVFNIPLTKTLLGPLGLAQSEPAKLGLKLLVIILTLALILPLSRKPGRPAALLPISGLLICALILLSPILWVHHLAYLILPLTIAALREFSDPEKQIRHLTLVLGLYFILSQSMLCMVHSLKIAPAYFGLSTLLVPLVVIILALTIFKGAGRGSD